MLIKPCIWIKSVFKLQSDFGCWVIIIYFQTLQYNIIMIASLDYKITDYIVQLHTTH